MLEGEGDDIEGEEQKGYTDVTVREAVEWTMGKDTEFTYIDVRSAEEHEKLATVRYTTAVHYPRGVDDTKPETPNTTGYKVDPDVFDGQQIDNMPPLGTF